MPSAQRAKFYKRSCEPGWSRRGLVRDDDRSTKLGTRNSAQRYGRALHPARVMTCAQFPSRNHPDPWRRTLGTEPGEPWRPLVRRVGAGRCGPQNRLEGGGYDTRPWRLMGRRMWRPGPRCGDVAERAAAERSVEGGSLPLSNDTASLQSAFAESRVVANV